MKRLVALLLLLVPSALAGQGRDEEFYYPGRFNWSFLRVYPEAAGLFNAFDYGHAILYETLVTVGPERAVAELENDQFRFLVGDLLRHPPRFSVAEEAIMPEYSRMAWRAKLMFERAHVLHRQIYDAYADPKLDDAGARALVERLIDHYLADSRYAFVDKPKAMALMDDQYYSQAFKRTFPKFNGLIWAYHWLQVGLYESLITESTPEGKRESIRESIARFWAMTEDAPRRLPDVMPMSVAVAPTFSDRHPRAAIIFDNLHMMHDIISDVLTSEKVAGKDKVAVIEAALDEFQNPTGNLVDPEHWKMMADHMGGVARMGGVAGRRPPR